MCGKTDFGKNAVFQLALRNVKRQIGNYLIYFMTVALTVALLFAINNIIYSRNLAVFVDRGESASAALKIVVVMISLVVAFVLSYAISFLLKRRKREFGAYLTLGMTRRDLLTIFLVETMVICIAALGVGLAAGAFLFQGLMAVMMKLLETEFVIAAYSAEGLLYTALLTVGIFLLASAASAVYLWRVSIYDLIHGEKKVEREARHPLVWFLLSILALVTLTGCCVFFFRKLDQALLGQEKMDGAGVYLIVFALSLVLLHAGLAKSIVSVLLRRPKLCSRGFRTFVLRQLSGNLSANALMLGCLAFLLTFAVIGTNMSFIQKVSQKEALRTEYPYDIVYYSNKYYYQDGTFPLEEAERLIEEYAGIRQRIPFHIYESGGQDFYSRTEWYEERMAPMDSFMPLSDFNAVMKPLGVEPVALEGQFMIVSNHPKAAQADWSDMIYECGGNTYTFHSCRSDYPQITYLYFFVVVPDEAVADMECVEESVAYSTRKERYDGVGLEQALVRFVSSVRGEEAERTAFEIREYHRQEENNISAILVVGALFAAAVFLLLAMAILALKTLSALGEDKRRYEILFRLGMGEREQARALRWQTSCFFLLPFVLPMAMSVPVSVFGAHLMRVGQMEDSAATVPLIAGIVAAVMALLYLLYYMAAYQIAKRAVVRER